MIIVTVVGGSIGGLLFIAGVIGYFVMALISNYGNIGLASIRVGIGMLSILIMLLFTIAFLIYGAKEIKFFDKEVKIFSKVKRNPVIIWSIIQIILIIALLIYGYNNPYYSSKCNIVYSPIMSAFATPAWIYFWLLVIGIIIKGITDVGEIFIWPIITLVVAAGIANGIVFFCFLSGATAVLDENFHLENRRALEIRKEDYGSTEFKDVFPKIFEHKRNYWIGELGETQEKFKSQITDYFNEQFNVSKCEENKTNPNIITCKFKDKSLYDKENKKLIYYATMDFSNNTVLNTYTEEEYDVATIENKTDISELDASKYAVWKVVSLKEEITKENINSKLQYLQNAHYTCTNVEEYDKEQIKVSMADINNLDDTSEYIFNKKTGLFSMFVFSKEELDLFNEMNNVGKNDKIANVISGAVGLLVIIIMLL